MSNNNNNFISTTYSTEYLSVGVYYRFAKNIYSYKMNTTTCQKLSKNNDSLDESAATNDLNEPNLKGDWINIFILLLLYIMHNFPLGLCSAITILMQSRKDTFFQDQVGTHTSDKLRIENRRILIMGFA